jgi:hypothetical protein
MQEPMSAVVEPEMNETFADYQRGNLRSRVIILRFTHKSGAVFKRIFLIPQKALSINCDSRVICAILLPKVLKNALDF